MATLVKIELGQIWFDKRSFRKPIQFYEIIGFDKSFARSNVGSGNFTHIDSDHYSLTDIISNGWHFKWSEEMICETHGIHIKMCPSCSLPKFKLI